ncbi:MAG: phasin family protein [Paracoccaceae bacterium]
MPQKAANGSGEEQSALPPTFDIVPFVNANATGFTAMADAQSHALIHLSKATEKTLAFVSHRLEQDQIVMKELVACKSAPEALAVWARFVENGWRDYAEEANVFAHLFADQTRETVESVQRDLGEAAKAAPPGGRHG